MVCSHRTEHSLILTNYFPDEESPLFEEFHDFIFFL